MTVLEHTIEAGTKRATNHHQLALRTLSTLLSQHNKNNDLRDLLRTLVLSVSGQFRTPSVFVHLVNLPMALPDQLTYFGVGRFRHGESTIASVFLDAIKKKFEGPISALRKNDLSDDHIDNILHDYFEETGVHLLLPFRHDDKLIGILGLGCGMQNDVLSNDDVDVLVTYATSVAPFIGNLFLFLTLASANQRHTNILNATKQAVMVFDRDGYLISLNEAAKDMVSADQPHDINRPTLIGMSHKAIFQSNMYPQWDRLLSDIELDPSARREGLSTVKSDANGRVFRLSVTLLDETAPQESDIVVVIDDISELKEKEAQMISLQVAADKGHMVSEIAHEMSNFIFVILGNAELAHQACQNANQEKAIKKLEELIEKASLLQRYSDGLVTRQDITPKWSSEDINSLIGNTISFCEIQKRFTGIEITQDLDRNVPSIVSDRNQITQVLLNLLNNASDAIREAGRANGKIEVSSSLDGDEVIIRMTDNGTGIPKDIAERLFVDALTTKKDGHGHGMIVCHKIITNHHGNISVDSEVGQGSTFTIRLPVNRP